MRSGLISGNTLCIIVVLASLLEGCGHKSPLMLPARPVQTSPAQASSPSTPDTQKSGLLTVPPNK